MKIVTDIADELYDIIQEVQNGSIVSEWVLNAVKNGTPLPKGHWFIDERPECNRETICSNCERPIFKYHKLDFDYRPHFCPNCGANMEVGNETDG